MSTTNDPYEYSMSESGANRPYDPSQSNVQQMPNIAYDHTSNFAYNLTAFPTQEFARDNWPPSVAQAARYSYHAPLTLRQRYSGVSVPGASTGEFWQAPHTVTPLSYQDRTRSLALPHIVGSQGVYNRDPYATTGYTDASSQHSTIDPNAFTEMAEDRHSPRPSRPRSSGASRTNSEGDEVQDLQCLVCGDTTFTGYCAQRNYNRHMERHNNAKSILCSKPECTKTFGRGDALLVHLRRSHPELGVPPAKKRKNAD